METLTAYLIANLIAYSFGKLNPASEIFAISIRNVTDVQGQAIIKICTDQSLTLIVQSGLLIYPQQGIAPAAAKAAKKTTKK